jgi:hypothetical protein
VYFYCSYSRLQKEINKTLHLQSFSFCRDRLNDVFLKDTTKVVIIVIKESRKELFSMKKQ